MEILIEKNAIKKIKFLVERHKKRMEGREEKISDFEDGKLPQSNLNN